MRLVIAFQKTEQVRHLGHLDIQRAVQRALRRSNVPVRYSEGFHPHAVLSFASPLPVGVSGDYELMEIGLATECDIEKTLSKIRDAMPKALPILGGRAILDTHPKLMAKLKMADYRAIFEADNNALQLANAIGEMLRQKEIIALRKTKSGEHSCDIRPMLHVLQADINDQLIQINFRVSLMELETLKPSLLLETLAKYAGVQLPSYRLCRVQLLTERNGCPVNLMEY